MVIRLILAVLLICPLGAQTASKENDKQSDLRPISAGSAQMWALIHTAAGVGGSYFLLKASQGGRNDLVKFVPFVYGAVIGPSVGNLIADDGKRAYRGMLIRIAGLTLMAGGFAKAIDDRRGSGGFLGMHPLTSFTIGMFAVGGSAIYNFLSTKQSVAEYNARIAQSKWQMGLLPEKDGLRLGMAFRL